jgi:anti-sigma B factor antagonist
VSAQLDRASPLTLTVEREDSSVCLRMAGELDLATIGQMMAAVDRIDVNRTSRLVVDLREVDFLDIAGLKAILRCNDQCKEHDIPVTVVKPQGYASRIFTLMRVNRELHLVDARA